MKSLSEIKNGDVIAFQGGWLLSKLIKWWTRQEVTHVGLAMWLKPSEDAEPRLCILEAALDGIRLVPLDVILEQQGKNKVYWCGLKDEEVGKQVLGYALETWGRPYARFWQFVIIAFPYLRKAFNKPLDNDDTRFHCSEIVSRSFERAGYKLDKVPALTTPGDIFTKDWFYRKELLNPSE